jgi:hypothetical protein
VGAVVSITIAAEQPEVLEFPAASTLVSLYV